MTALRSERLQLLNDQKNPAHFIPCRPERRESRLQNYTESRSRVEPSRKTGNSALISRYDRLGEIRTIRNS